MNKIKMDNNKKKGFTIVELIVSFSLTMIVMIYLLRTIVVISNKENELLTLQEYTVVETELLSNIYRDMKGLNPDNKVNPKDVKIIDDSRRLGKEAILIDALGYDITFDREQNYIIYDDVIYELPDGVKIDEPAYNVYDPVIDTSMISENTVFYVAKINLIVNNKKKSLKIIHQYFDEKVMSGANQKVCKRVTKQEDLHTEECTQTDTTYYCSGAGYTESGSKGTKTITYGNIGTSGTLASGDAFDCDVTGTGNYERFYYVTDLEGNSNVAVLIYYNNIKNGKANNTSAGLIAYDSTHGTGESAQNWHGPISAITNLPKNSDWENVGLTKEIRAITNQNGGNTTTNGVNTLPSNFSYEGYAARLLTAQEVNKACGITIGSYRVGELDQNCTYLLENTKYSSSGMGTYGYWLENPVASSSSNAWNVHGYIRYGNYYYVSTAGVYGVRPAIEVLKSDISY